MAAVSPAPSRDRSGAARALLVAIGLAASASSGFADEPDLTLEVPVVCDMDRICSIQKYVDHDPGPQRMDYACGRLSKDGDTGTDFRVPDYPTMERGVAVVAAAPGVVSAVRDGMEDMSVAEIGHEAIRGRWAGNGVVIDHGNGFETQYSHLRRGSVAVAVGQQVTTGETLGLIGLSGNTEFPHLDFSVRYRGRPIDPFVGLSAFTTCGDPRKPLWSAAAAARLPYRATVLLNAGFAGERPDPRAARHGAYDKPLPASAEALVFWVDVSGAMAGDRERFLVTAPDGETLLEREERISASNISWFSFAGLRQPPSGWPAGGVTANYALIRDGAAVVSAARTITFE